MVQPHTFYADAMNGRLPSLAWIDPNFVDLGGLVGADDDHPPTDVMAAQSFVLKVYDIVDRLPFVHRRPKGKVVISAEANELERGVAAAAVVIRKKGLPPGQR